jgi:hypothetical protein
MRFFPAFYTLASPAMQARHAKMVKLQQLWLTKQVKVIQNRQIVAIDAPDKHFGNRTLRDVLMSIKGPDGRKPLLHAIARGKQPGQGWIIMTNDKNFPQADSIFASVITYLKHQFELPDSALKAWFHSYALLRAEQDEWDAVNHTVLTAAD